MRPARIGLYLVAVAAAFGAAGMLSSHLFPHSQPPLIGQLEEVRIGAFWDAHLPDLGGRDQPLSQWHGKVMVANFWAPWCPPCRVEIPGFIRMQQRYAQAGVQFVGLAVDEKDSVSGFARRAGFNYPILLVGESDGQLLLDAGNGMGGLPYTVIFDRRGKAIATITGVLAEERLEKLIKSLL